MKIVSFKVAKAIKDCGYPQNIDNWEYIDDNTSWYFPDGTVEKKKFIKDYIDETKLIFAPTYMKVWHWLWQEKGIKLSIEPNEDETECYTKDLGKLISKFGRNPEEAIVKAIDYLVDNNLIK